MRKLFALLAFIVLLNSTDPHPKQVGASEIDFSLSWQVTNEGPTTLKVYAFLNDSKQTVSFNANKNYQFEDDKFGNRKTVFKFQSQGTQVIEVTGKAKVDYTAREENKEKDLAQYLAQTPLVKLDDKVKQAAGQVVAGSKNDFEKLVRLTEWVHNHVEYDDSYWQTQEPSDKVLQEGRGVCDEYAHLLIAMLRQEKIPAKFVAGFVFSGNKWDAHAWTEAIIDGQVIAADPTYNEAGFLDGTHVKFAAAPDQSYISEEITASASMQKPTPRFAVTKFDTPDQRITTSFANYPKTAGPGEVASVVLEIENNEDKQKAVPLSIVVPTIPKKYALEIAGKKDKLVFLAPNEKKQAEWKVIFPKSLEEGLEYNFTSYVTTLGENKSFTTMATSKNSPPPVPLVETGEVYAEQKGEFIVLSTQVTNNGNTDTTVNATLETASTKTTQSFELRQGETRQVFFNVEQEQTIKGKIMIAYDNFVTTTPIQITISQPTPKPAPNPPTDYVPFAILAVLLLAGAAYALRKQ